MKEINNELIQIISKLEVQGKMSFMPETNLEQISKFELENNIKLPKKYKEWLMYSDGGELFLPAGVQLYGIAHNPLIDINEGDKPNDNYIVIGALSDGRPILCEKDNENISIYNHELGIIEKNEEFSDFFDFLNNIDSKLS